MTTHRATWKTDLTRAALIGDAQYDVVVITDDDLRRADEMRRLDRTPSPHAQVGSSYACSGP